MKNAVIGDKFPTQQGVKERKFDTPTADNAQPTRPAPADGNADVADVSRAHQRLLQEAGTSRATTFQTMSEARASLAQLHNDIATDPGAVLRVAANIDQNTFEAAIARPGG